MRINPFLLAILLFLLFFHNETFAQCAMCRASLESEEGLQQAKGINNGIVYLMIFPYLLMGVLGFFVYKKMKNKKKS
ncbi:hypothetical protein [Capnocytophaga canimorsus]|uniref:Uncharacterized protein n=2 Tax=Capnocytophaga canimorsus TaxID=28188 RepID=F9YVJ1_CAPCC|nr:hypothetical protein [Capnocytophaga canimorsus]AEK24425.1 Conserved hypothetical protein [Capnocytophaga canimorsus Cc5]ATA77290.1 hypothetical protein CGC47_06710 [Capnocytophaga canimorsus]ATA91906.1 hypothetical protein CGC56_06830 [Capnocytophaga canimorsus]AWL78756.1 hypothetical protein DKB58_07295 [Capnocytophaga canimorsus]AYW37365.1 hypothetical protein D8L92_08720 [Capnocytophaga canimorsus]